MAGSRPLPRHRRPLVAARAGRSRPQAAGLKAGDGARPANLEEIDVAAAAPGVDLIALDDALECERQGYAHAVSLQPIPGR